MTPFFGMDRPDGRASEDDWHIFLARESTPWFPAGLIVTAAVGQWRHGDRQVQEPSRVHLDVCFQ